MSEKMERSDWVGLSERADWCTGNCRCITVHKISSYPEGKLVWSCSLCGGVSHCIGGGV